MPTRLSLDVVSHLSDGPEMAHTRPNLDIV